MNHILSAHFGQTCEYTSFAVLEEEPEDHIQVRHLNRLRQRSYPDLIAELKAMAGRLQEPVLAVDVTRVGEPVLEAIRAAGIGAPIRAITVISGDSMIQEGLEYRVPERDLVSTVTLALQTGRLKFAKGLKNAPILDQQLRSFPAKVSISATESFAAVRAGENDDLVLAVAIGCWIAPRASHPDKMLRAFRQAYGL